MTPSGTIDFPPFRLDPTEQQLRRGKQRLTLQPRPFSVLLYLLRHPGRLITKEELIATVWQGTVVTNETLKVGVEKIRKALRDNARAPRFVETVHGRGYRFIGKVVSSQHSVSGSEEESQEAKGKNQKSVLPAPVPPLGGGRQAQVSPSATLRTGVVEGAKVFLPPLAPNIQHPTPVLVGREAELAQLHTLLAAARNGRRQIVFVTGEPGIGKTTLVDAFIAGLTTDTHILIACGQCNEHSGVGEPYQPVLDALEWMCRQPGHKKLVSQLRRYAPLWLEQMPALLDPEQHNILRQETRKATRERMLREIAVFLETLTAETPLVLWLEDLHWSDPSTLDLLAALARRREAARLLLIGTYRPVEVLITGHPLHAMQQELHGHQLSTELALPWLSETAVEEYLRARFAGGGPHPLPLQRLAHILYRRTEGNPLSLTSTVEDLLAHDVISLIDEGWVLRGGLEAVTARVPNSLRLLIKKHMDRLTSEDQLVLSAASVVGHEFSAAAVAAVLQLDIEEVELRCAELARRQQFLRPVESYPSPERRGATRYTFRHALSRKEWHESLSPARRQHFHQRIGEWKEVSYGQRNGGIAAELALHFEYGRDYTKAVRHYGQAAEIAIRRHASWEAVAHLTKARELLQKLPDTPGRAQDELGLLFNLRVQLGRLKGEAAPELEDVVVRIRELSQQVEQTPSLFWALAGVYLFYVVREELSPAKALAEQRVHLAQRFPEPLFVMAAYTELGIACFLLGELSRAKAHFEQALARYDPQSPHPFSFDWEHGPPCLCYAALVLWYLGYPDQALQKSEEAIRRAQALRLPYMQSFVGNFTAHLYQLRRELDMTHTQAVTAIQLATQHEFTNMAKMGRIFLGWAQAREDKSENGVAQMRHSIAAYRVNGENLFRAYYLALLADTCSYTGQVTEGLAALTEAIEVVQHTGGRYYEAELYRLKGELTLQKEARGLRLETGSPPSQASKSPVSMAVEQEAEEYFRKAIEIARQQHAKSLELRATTSLVRLRQQQATLHVSRNMQHVTRVRLDEAHRMLSNIYNWFTEGFATADLQEAKVLLEELAKL